MDFDEDQPAPMVDMQGKLIGLSLSFCIRDILAGTVSLDQVEKIICGTKITDDESLEEVIEGYCRVYWAEDPERAGRIARAMWQRSLLEQPRVTDRKAPKIHDGHWVNSEDQVRYWSKWHLT